MKWIWRVTNACRIRNKLGYWRLENHLNGKQWTRSKRKRKREKDPSSMGNVICTGFRETTALEVLKCFKWRRQVLKRDTLETHTAPERRPLHLPGVAASISSTQPRQSLINAMLIADYSSPPLFNQFEFIGGGVVLRVNPTV